MSNTYKTIFSGKIEEGEEKYVFTAERPAIERHKFHITSRFGEVILTIPENEDVPFKDAIMLVKDLLNNQEFKTALSGLAGVPDIKSITFLEKEIGEDGRYNGCWYYVRKSSDVLKLVRRHFKKMYSLYIPEDYSEEEVFDFINRLNYVRDELIRIFDNEVFTPLIKEKHSNIIFCSAEEKTRFYDQFTPMFKDFVQKFKPSEEISPETRIYFEYLKAYDVKDVRRQKELIEELKNLSQE